MERGHVKERQKSSKSVKKKFDTFRRQFRAGQKHQSREKVSKYFPTIFARNHFSGPFLGGSDLTMLDGCKGDAEPEGALHKKSFIADRDASSADLESGNATGALLQVPAPVLDTLSGPMGA